MADASVKVSGIRETHRALKTYDAGAKAGLELALRQAGEIVAAGAQQRFSAIDQTAAAGIRSRVKGFGRVVVEQRKRKTTGDHPEFGIMQMTRALIPSRAENEPRVVEAVEQMMDGLNRRFN